MIILDKKNSDATADRKRLVDNATSFLRQQSMLAVDTSRQSLRTIGIIAAAAGAARVILGDPIEDAACSALSIFSFCSDNTEPKADVDNLLQHQTGFQKTMEKVQSKNDEILFLLKK